MNILITGSNRGLGLEFVKQYLQRRETVIATCRSPKMAHRLQKLKEQYGEKISLVKLEVTDQDSRNKALLHVKDHFAKLDLIINNAGIRSGGSENSYTLGELQKENMSKVFQVNSIAPVLIAEEFLALIEKGTNPKIINITSWLGSIGSKTRVFRYSYCASKTALNMFSKLMSIELKPKGVIVLALHPGHVKTDLGGPHAPLVPQQSIMGMINVIDSLDLQDSGKYLDWQGNEIPW